jgi:hypothetical protein
MYTHFIWKNTGLQPIGPRAYSPLFKYTQQHCRFDREQQLGPAPHKTDPGYGYLITNLYFVFKYTQKTHTSFVFMGKMAI